MGQLPLWSWYRSLREESLYGVDVREGTTRPVYKVVMTVRRCSRDWNYRRERSPIIRAGHLYRSHSSPLIATLGQPWGNLEQLWGNVETILGQFWDNLSERAIANNRGWSMVISIAATLLPLITNIGRSNCCFTQPWIGAMSHPPL